MTKEDIDRLIENATEEQLRDIVRRWMETNDEFKTFVECSLNPPLDEVDFDAELGRAMMYEAHQCISRRGEVILDWSNIFYYQIEPWAKKAESLNTQSLWKLIVAIITRVTMVIDDNDLTGDEWYGNDYSQDIRNILETLGNLCGLLVTRADLTDEGLTELEGIVEEAQTEDKIWNYMTTPYDTILKLIAIRREADKVSRGLYDLMIGANYNQEAGVWVCRKVDFVRSMGLNDEAQSMLEQNLKYPEVCLKYYNELMVDNRWQDASNLLDKAQKLRKENTQRWFGSISPDWLSMKHALIMRHGTKEMQIANLTEMFYNSIGEKKNDCYMSLKNWWQRKIGRISTPVSCHVNRYASDSNWIQ